MKGTATTHFNEIFLAREAPSSYLGACKVVRITLMGAYSLIIPKLSSGMPCHPALIMNRSVRAFSVGEIDIARG